MQVLYLNTLIYLCHVLLRMNLCLHEAGGRHWYQIYNIFVIRNIQIWIVLFVFLYFSVLILYLKNFIWAFLVSVYLLFSLQWSFFSSLNGFLQGWDFESINTAIGNASNMFEMEPINEMMVGHNVSLSFAVKSSLPDSFTWFAQVSLIAAYKIGNFTKTFSQHPS